MIDVEKGNDLFLNEQQACEMHLALALPARKKRKILSKSNKKQQKQEVF